MILDMAGNVGTQSLAVTIRVLMDEDISAMQKLGFVFKEMRIGFLNGLLLGSASFVVIGIFVHIMKQKSLFFSFALSGCVGISLLTAMVISSLVGVLVPMLFHKLKVDPAVASGPLITTVNDLVAVVTYYGLAEILLVDVFHLV
jgi:magnesium transporter